MIGFKFGGGFFLLGLSVVFANAPLSPPSSYIGIDYMQMAGDWTSLNDGVTACFPAGCGGEFSGNITMVGQGPADLANAVTANFWCIDFQENFDYSYSGYADVVPLADVSGNDHVRYSDVGTGVSTPDWSTQLGSNYATAQVRYDMAAWLVSQYPGVLGNLNDPVISSDGSAIQEAIWVIMSNTSSGPGFSPQFTDSDAQTIFSNQSDVDTWIGQAELNYTSIPGQWAIVSWSADPSSAPPGALLSDGANYQTFLVDLAGPTPEPRLYAILALGLSGIFAIVRRRKNA